MTTEELVESYCEEQGIARFEGESGVRNLARVVGALGYHDPQYFGQFAGGSYGDLILFLEDNPGAMDAIITWIGKQQSPEWQTELRSRLHDTRQPESA